MLFRAIPPVRRAAGGPHARRWATSLSITSPALAVLLAGPWVPASAQQFVTDDAALADLGACELEAWTGPEESWVLPVCHLVPGVEITAGAMFADLGRDSWDPLAVVEAKTLFRDRGEEGWSVGAVVGTAVPTQSQFARPAEVFAYAPLTLYAQELPVVGHLNLGWSAFREEAEGTTHTDHFLMWGAKLGVGVLPRIELVGELFGLAGEETHAQAGIRTEVVPDRLTLDASHGMALEGGGNGLGPQVGMAWTPRPLR